MRVALYVRVSTQDQNHALQQLELEQYAAAHGWTITETYQDTMSGAKSGRPGLLRLLDDAQARKFDCVLVWKLDRFGRSLRDCLTNIETLERHDIRFISTTQNLDTDKNDPAARFLLHVLGAAAEFERSLIKDRVHAGLKAAKKAGKTLGRPKLVFNRDEAHRLRAEGMSLREIGKQLGLGRGTVERVLGQAA